MRDYRESELSQKDDLASLESLLQTFGISVPDQTKIPHMMEATRIGLLPTVSKLRLSVAWYRRSKRCNSPYIVYDYDSFCRGAEKEKRISHLWGGDPPAAVVRNVEKIRKNIPGARCFVHATYDDPWLEVRLEGESVFIHCWLRSSPKVPAELVI